jgi:hypothetical protein
MAVATLMITFACSRASGQSISDEASACGTASPVFCGTSNGRGSRFPKALAADPEMVLEACVFETVSPGVEQIPIPDWVFTALGQPAEKRNFIFTNMIYAAAKQRRAMGRNAQVPDETRMETQLWFYYQAASYIDAGFEGIHFGQVEIMNKNDPDNAPLGAACLQSGSRLRGQTRPTSHGVVQRPRSHRRPPCTNGNPLLDFNAFPLRIMETPDKPQEAILKLDFPTAFITRARAAGLSAAGRATICPTSWSLTTMASAGIRGSRMRKAISSGFGAMTKSLGSRIRPKITAPSGCNTPGIGCGRRTPNGYLEMPGSRTATSPDTRWYFANNPSPAVPNGMGDEEAIRAVWAADAAKSADEKPAAAEDGKH